MESRVNDQGRRIGEGHPKARWPEWMVEEIFRLAADGVTAASIAKLLGMPGSTVRSILSGKARCQEPDPEDIRRVPCRGKDRLRKR